MATGARGAAGRARRHSGCGGPAGRHVARRLLRRPVLLDSTGVYAGVAAPWRDRVDVVTGPLEGTTATAMLVRPDCFVAWSAGDAATLRALLTHHFGVPR
ncbi:hypothetical protein [Micromonospora sp. NPDC048898]|uniref:aromatic-ring hydroxylase C-terminal domain-containing protein n=1 Tax=Micromonospora sp. NPDC048898 TaxID=3364260 RepID=UPI003721C1BB